MRAATRVLGWALGACALGLTLAVLAPLAVGARPYTVLTGSMEPAIAPGDVVVVRRIAPASARPGDVVTFQSPDEPRRLITHRVRSVRRSGAKVEFVTKGDANNAAERWRIDAAGDISRVIYRVPWVGRVALFSRTRTGLVLLVLLPLLALGAHELWRTWRPAGGHDEAAA